MQTKGCAFCRQGSSKNADKFCRRIFSRHFPPECRQTSSKMQTRALDFSRNRRQIMQTKSVYPESGDVCILVCLQAFCNLSTGILGVLQRCLQKCRQSLSTYMNKFVCISWISLNESLVRAASHSELVQQPVRVELLLGSN